MQFKHAATSDINLLLELIHSGYRGETSRNGWTTEADLLEGQRTDAPSLQEVIENPKSIIVITLQNDRIVSCFQLDDVSPETAYFGLFVVRPDLQGNGLGHQMISHAEDIAENEWGKSFMTMHVIKQRSELIAWYERLGYVQTGEFLPFPYGNERFGIPMQEDLAFTVLTKTIR